MTLAFMITVSDCVTCLQLRIRSDSESELDGKKKRGPKVYCTTTMYSTPNVYDFIPNSNTDFCSITLQ